MQKTHDSRFLPFGWWHMLKVLKWHRTPLVDLLLIGVLPEYRSKGANALIFDDLIRWFQRYHFEWAITGPQMESNEGVLSQWQWPESTPVSSSSLLPQDAIRRPGMASVPLNRFILCDKLQGVGRQLHPRECSSLHRLSAYRGISCRVLRQRYHSRHQPSHQDH